MRKQESMPTTESRAAAAAAGMSPPFRGPPFATSPPTKFGFLTAVRASSRTVLRCLQRNVSILQPMTKVYPYAYRFSYECVGNAKMAVWKGVFSCGALGRTHALHK